MRKWLNEGPRAKSPNQSTVLCAVYRVVWWTTLLDPFTVRRALSKKTDQEFGALSFEEQSGISQNRPKTQRLRKGPE